MTAIALPARVLLQTAQFELHDGDREQKVFAREWFHELLVRSPVLLRATALAREVPIERRACVGEAIAPQIEEPLAFHRQL